MAKKKSTKTKTIKTLEQALFTEAAVEELSTGDDVRVRPKPKMAKTFGQGTNTGPRIGLNGEQISFTWGQALRVAGGSGLGNPAKNTVTKTCIALGPGLFMSEQDYQDLLSSSTK